MKSIAGTLVGKDRHTVVVVDGPENKYVKSIKLLGDRVYIARLRRQEEDGPIILADKSQDNNNCFMVLAVGPKCMLDIQPTNLVGCASWAWEAHTPGFDTTDERIVPSKEILLRIA